MSDWHQKNEARSVDADAELQEGIWAIGKQYHVRTPTYQYLGDLVAVTETVFVLAHSGTVYSTGAYQTFYAEGIVENVQWHEKTSKLIIDRGGTAMHERDVRVVTPWDSK